MPFKILFKEKLAEDITLIEVEAPLIARKAKPGQFVILRVDERGERFPLTLYDWNKEDGTIKLVFKEVGVSTMKLSRLKVGESILDVVGPLGNPGESRYYGVAVVIGGGVGIPCIYPRAKELKRRGNRVIAMLGARSANLLILEDAVKRVCDEIYIATDDGSRGFKGFTSQLLEHLLNSGLKIDYVFAVGPVLMMKAIAEVTRKHGVRTDVSLNPIMIDGTGMCGACRVTIGGETKFTCIHGPEFNAHLVDFDELIKRLNMYRDLEEIALRKYRDEWSK